MNDSSGEQCGTRDDILMDIVDDFSSRQQAGESPNIESYVDRHPDMADAIRHTLEAIATLQLLSSFDFNPIGEENDPPQPRLLGEFRIQREIGRGGMGVVYEAEQVSLSRKVALKVLPYVAMLDSKRVKRFKNEAQAAATLHHSNIVHVYATGSERSVHFYAMQFIDGQTLAELIKQLRDEEQPGARPADDDIVVESHQPENVQHKPELGLAAAYISTLTKGVGATKRSATSNAYYATISKLIVQACNALEYAHQHGIIHRDIKPSNLMVDADGRIWVTDFGLAQMECEPQLTMTGDMVGTLKYMSPEQALAKRVTIDHRTDIYSLGATLYELLTLRPVIASEERQQILKSLAFDEPQDPGKLRASVPRELGTIALKALEKDPDARYQSAKEMGDDIARFLHHEPIRAKRPGPVRRVSKWMQRNPWLVRSAATFLVMSVVGLFAFSMLLIRETERSESRLKHARTNFDLAMSALDRIYLPLIERHWTKLSLTEADRRLVDDGLEIYQQLALQNAAFGDEAAMEAAIAYRRLGDLYRLRNDSAAAEAALQESIKRLSVIDNPHSQRKTDLELIQTNSSLAAIRNADGRFEAGLEINAANLARLDLLDDRDDIFVRHLRGRELGFVRKVVL